jgi:uncharacterized protein with PQ loop repeat
MPSSNAHLHRIARTRRTKQLRTTALIDQICLVFSVLMPLTTLPQVIQLYTSHDASGLSLLMWVLYSVGILPFLAFGYIHKIKQLVILNILWLIVNGLMIYGIVKYTV